MPCRVSDVELLHSDVNVFSTSPSTHAPQPHISRSLREHIVQAKRKNSHLLVTVYHFWQVAQI